VNAFPTYGSKEEEEAFSRDVDGRLIGAEKATHTQLAAMVTLRVDGEPVAVHEATPWLDDQGRVRSDPEGRPMPRGTTLYDAIAKRYTPKPDVSNPVPKSDNPVTVLCHQEHLDPIAVCRVCSVLLSKGGKAEARLVPACKRHVAPNLEVHTGRSRELISIAGRTAERAGEYVARTVRQVVELIAVDHLHDRMGDRRPYHNELLAVSQSMELSLTKPPEPSRSAGRDLVSHLSKVNWSPIALVDDTSKVIRFDRASCILCDRCVRSCHDVKPFSIISHTGRGREARITFDLDDPMQQSGCVSCGECAVSCPTGALSFRGTVYQDRDPWADQVPKPVTVEAEELREHPLFAGVPFAFLKWNQGAVGRRTLNDGDHLCEKGEFGTTAFVIEQGSLEIVRGDGLDIIETTPLDVIVGEMAFMNNRARNATVRAKGPARILVVRRNMLHMLRRNSVAREILERAYAERALANWMAGGTLFPGFPEDERRKHVEFLSARPEGDVKFVRVDPKQIFLRQGDRVDSVYFLREGHVEVSEVTPSGDKQVRDYLGPGWCFGEIAIMSELSEAVAKKLGGIPRGRRTGTCIALDHVELIRVSKEAIVAMLTSERFPKLRDELERRCLELISKSQDIPEGITNRLRNEFTRLGLYEGQNLLVIDLERCTRCLECVSACADTHQPQTRLLFEGDRFHKYLVPGACRSCHDPLCLIGCPVDAIHRPPAGSVNADQPALAVYIEDHCIGCGLCAHNCPFNAIQMHDAPQPEGELGPRVAAPARIARNCDLCESLDGVPRCVYACPHDAAKRTSGYVLMESLKLNMLGPAPAAHQSSFPGSQIDSG